MVESFEMSDFDVYVRLIVDAAKEKQFLRKSSEAFSLKIFNSSDLLLASREATFPTLYILGSGSSVNSLGELEFDQVKASTSVGINHWTLHPFIPNFYSIEFLSRERAPHASALVGRRFHSMNHLRILRDRKAHSIDPTIICLRPRDEFEMSQLREAPHHMVASARAYGRVTPRRAHPDSLPRILERSISTSRALPESSISVDSGASVARLVFFGIVAGFSEVVLLGVDLNNSEYFWDSRPEILGDLKIPNFPRRKIEKSHPTMMRENRPHTILDMLLALSLAGEKFGTKLTTGTSGYLLDDYLPQHRWQ